MTTSSETPRSPTAPNIVVVQADQLAAAALGVYGNSTVQSPHIDALGEDGVVFDRAYCNSPLCAPSRASMMTGELPSTIGVHDNGADFGASVPTFAHQLRTAGYHTALIGRMHFIGPDQLHGFEERLTTDVYPADLDMVPDWDLPERDRLPWYHDADSVFTAGVSTATVQRDFDDEVIFRTLRFLNDRVRARDDQPFLLVSSFIHPHDPYEPPAEHWQRYDDVEIDAPRIPTMDPADLDPHSRRLLTMCGLDARTPSEEEIQHARRAYYACVSYVDDLVGQIVDRLEELGLRENTVVIVTADHGDMLGERGLWYKMSPFEQSSRVPLIVNAPQWYAHRRVEKVVSLVDLAPTLVDLAGGEPRPGAGASLAAVLAGSDEGPDEAVIEYLAEGLTTPQITFVRGPHKLVVCPGDPDQLFDVVADPDELVNLAGDPDSQDLLAELRAEIERRYDLDALAATVRESQQRRRFVQQALAAGSPSPWDHQPLDPSTYVRGDFWSALNTGRIAPVERSVQEPQPEATRKPVWPNEVSEVLAERAETR